MPLPLGFVHPVIAALDEQPPAVRDRLWTAIDRGDLTYSIEPDGRMVFKAGGEAFLRLECIGAFPVSVDNGLTH